MTKGIIGKLARHLEQPITTECGVVYLMAEIRKVLEKTKPTPKPVALWMYCHWCLHVDLTKSETTAYFLQRIDDFASDTIYGLKPNRPYTFIESHHLFKDFMELQTFRDELKGFLEMYDLPTNLCTDSNSWNRFLTEYFGVVEDGKLSCEKGKPALGITAIEKVTISKGGAPFVEDSALPFTVRWDILLKDGRTCRITLEESTGKYKMMSHHIELIAAPVIPPGLSATN